MKRGPQPGRARNGDTRSFAQKAALAWAPLPDWVGALAELADRLGLKGAAARIGYSTTAVSQTINRTNLKLDLDRIAEKVGGALLGVTVDCPEPTLGTISRSLCLDWQKKPKAASSSLRARMFHTCRSCPNFRGPRPGEATDAT